MSSTLSPKFDKYLSLMEPDCAIELPSILNILLLFTMLFALNSRFVLSPGLKISLPTTNFSTDGYTAGVVTVQSDRLIILNGEIFDIDNLEEGLKIFAQKHLPTNSEKRILIRVDKSLPIQLVIKVCEISKKIGYSEVQIASCSTAER